MRTLWRRSLAAAFLLAASGAVLVSVAAPAAAQPVESGTLAFSGDPGDYISGGAAHSFDTAEGDVLTVSSAGNAVVTISVDGAGGEFWSVDFEARPDKR